MTSDVVLSAALRSNLLSLQSTQSLIDRTQLRLSTGRKVNSALDNPQNFFGAQALSDRAGDLAGLLDGLGQSISALQQTDNAVKALTTLVKQADSVAQQAKDALTSGAQEAKLVGDSDLSGVGTLTARTGIADGDIIAFSFIDTNNVPATSSLTIKTTISMASQAKSIDQLVTEINGIQDMANNQVFKAKLTESGEIQITELNGKRFQIDFGPNDSQFADALGFGGFATTTTSDAGTSDESRITVSATPSLISVALFDQSDAAIADRTTTLVNLTSAATGAAGDIFNGETNDALNISINGETYRTVISDMTTATVQDLIDGINTNSNLNQLVKADYDEVTGSLSLSAIDSTVMSIQFQVQQDNAVQGAVNAHADLLELGFGVQDITVADAANTNTSSESVQLGSAAGTLANLEGEYDNIRTQIDALVSDSSFRGVNLMTGDNLITTFNESRTNFLTTQGVTFTSAGLGMTAANFSRSSTVTTALSEVATALDSVRSFGGTLANDLAIIQTRQDFTKSTINTLSGAADKLTIADQNEEGAKLLALQTRQQLGVTALALASQSQQAVLQLF